LNERLRAETRGHFTAGDLIAAACTGGHQSLGWRDAGRLAVGMRADLVTISLDSVRTAGADDPEAAAVFAASAADVRHVVVDGRVVVSDGRHTSLDVARELTDSITAVTGERR